MAKEVRADVIFKGGMRFDGISGRAGESVAIDFAPEGEDVGGFLPLELRLKLRVRPLSGLVPGVLRGQSLFKGSKLGLSRVEIPCSRDRLV